jgi:hypothetical protein
MFALCVVSGLEDTVVRRLAIVLLGMTLATSSASFGQDPERDAQILHLIEQFTDHVCTVVEREGRSGNYEVSGQLGADVHLFVRKFFGFRGAGAGNRSASEYNNVLRQDLANLLRTNIECRLQVSTLLIKTLFAPPVMYKK